MSDRGSRRVEWGTHWSHGGNRELVRENLDEVWNVNVFKEGVGRVLLEVE